MAAEDAEPYMSIAPRWEDLPDGRFKDVIRELQSEKPPFVVNLDACVHDLTTLQMLLDVLREQEVYSVTTLSLRYCALKDDGAAMLATFVGEDRGAPPPVDAEGEGGDDESEEEDEGPDVPPAFLENLYVSSDTITEKGLTTLKDAWETQGQLWAGGNKRDGVHPSTFRRKPLSYNPTPEERMAMLPKFVQEAEAAGGGKKKGGKKGGKKKK